LTDRSSSREPSSTGDSASHAPGLGEQFGRTRKALLGLISAHLDLARAEFGEIGGQIKRAAAFGGIAMLLLFFAGLVVSVGGLLFLGEALFGSIGWGVLDGTLLLIGAAALLVLAVIDLDWSRVLAAFAVALAVALVVVGVLAVDWAAVSRNNHSLPGALVLGVFVGAVAFGLVGLALGSSFGKAVASVGLAAGVVLGLLLGWLASAGPGLRVAIALGVAALMLVWPICAAVMVFRHGIDMAKLRARFVPEQTIATTKETIEWVREQMPLGRKS
jgi:hypothetical protein